MKGVIYKLLKHPLIIITTFDLSVIGFGLLKNIIANTRFTINVFTFGSGTF
jgi:hypothetical protein